MQNTSSVESRRMKSFFFLDKFFVKILNKEKVIKIKEQGIKSISFWKIFIQDQKGIKEIYTENTFGIQKGTIGEIFNAKILYHRGKIKIFGSFKKVDFTFIIPRKIDLDSRKNYSQIVNSLFP